jgi:hypothetical protein
LLDENPNAPSISSEAPSFLWDDNLRADRKRAEMFWEAALVADCDNRLTEETSRGGSTLSCRLDDTI